MFRGLRRILIGGGYRGSMDNSVYCVYGHLTLPPVVTITVAIWGHGALPLNTPLNMSDGGSDRRVVNPADACDTRLCDRRRRRPAGG